MPTKLLNEAEQLVKTDAEKADVQRLRLDLDEATRKLQAREDENFTPLLADLNDRVRRLEAQRLDPRHGKQKSIVLEPRSVSEFQ